MADNRMLFTGIPKLTINDIDPTTITKEVKSNATIVMENDLGSSFTTSQMHTGKITIKGRGNTTWTLDKKPFNIVLTDSADKKKNVPLFGMPTDSEWCLLADYQDKTFVRTLFTSALSYAIGLPWCTRGIKVRLYFGTQYQGLYTLTEKVKQSTTRINTPTGAFTMEQLPQWQIGSDEKYFQDVRGRYLSYKVPDSDKVTDVQNAAAQTQWNDFLNRITGQPLDDLTNGYRAVADASAFAKYFLLEDLINNSDADYASWYITMVGSTISMGPGWDFNGTWGSAGVQSYTGTNIDFRDPTNRFLLVKCEWYARMMEDPYFANLVKAQFLSVAPALHQVLADLRLYIPQLVATGAVEEDRAKWPGILSDANLIPQANYAAEITRFLAFVSDRFFYQTRGLYDPIPPKPITTA